MGLMRDPTRIERLERAGMHRGVFWVPSVAEEIEQAMDRYAAAALEYERAGA
jgi:hypothetical protein